MQLAESHRLVLGKLAAIAVLAGALLGVARLVVVPPLQAFREHRTEMSELKVRLLAVEGEAARIPSLKARLAGIAAASAAREALWTGANDGAVAAAIQTRARQLLQGAGVTITRLDVPGPQSVPGFRRFTVRASFTGGDKDFVDVLVALARQRPYLKLESLGVRGSEINRPADHGEPSFATLLTVDLELSGLMEAAPAQGGKI